MLRIRPSALVLRRDEALLVHCRGDHFTLPGGGLEAGESVRDCVRRELREECGLVDLPVGPLVLTAELHPEQPSAADGRVPSIFLVFAVDAPAGTRPPGPQAPDEQQVGLRWHRVDRLDQLRLHPNLGLPLRNWASGRLTDPHVVVGW